MRRLAVLLLPLAFIAACADPPQKEIDLAQGAIDAARAAGAEQYAPEVFGQATSSLQQAHDAVAQRDYRLALTRALDAHDRAQVAARDAADGQARARGEAEAALVAAANALTQFQERITAAEAAKLPRRDLDAARRAAKTAQGVLQKARAAVTGGDYATAKALATGLPRQIAADLTALEAAAQKKPARPVRRSR